MVILDLLMHRQSKMPVVLFFLASSAIFSCDHTRGPSTKYVSIFTDSLLNKTGYQFRHVDSENFRFHFETGTYPDGKSGQLIGEAFSSLRKNMGLLELRKIHYSIDIIYFDNRQKLKQFTGFTPKGIAFPQDRCLLIATNDSTRAYHSHELMHIMAITELGYPADPGDFISEGLSVYADNPCMNYPLHQIAAYLLYSGMALSLDTLIWNFRKLPDMNSYMQAGSFTQYLIEKYGGARFKNLWRKGINAFKELYGADLGNMQRRYFDFLKKKYPQKPAIDWGLLLGKGCG